MCVLQTILDTNKRLQIVGPSEVRSLPLGIADRMQFEGINQLQNSDQQTNRPTDIFFLSFHIETYSSKPIHFLIEAILKGDPNKNLIDQIFSLSLYLGR